MLKNFIDSINIVLPIFLLIVLGFVLKKLKFASDKFYEDSEKFVFNVALPVQLFLNVAFDSSAVGGDYLRLIVFCVASVTAAFLIALLLVPLIVKNNGIRGAVIQNCFRSNFAILGIPLAGNLAGDTGRTLISILMPFVIIMYNVYTVIEMNIFAPSEVKKTPKELLLSIIKSTCKNPLIIAVVLALPMLITGWRPSANFAFAEKTLDYLSDTTQALVLISLGAGFSFGSLKGKLKYSLTASIYKVIVLPAIAVAVAHLGFGFSGVELALVFIMFGTPSAVSSYIMARNLKSDAEVASQVLMITTLLSTFTLFLGIFTLKSLNWI